MAPRILLVLAAIAILALSVEVGVNIYFLQD